FLEFSHWPILGTAANGRLGRRTLSVMAPWVSENASSHPCRGCARRSRCRLRHGDRAELVRLAPLSGSRPGTGLRAIAHAASFRRPSHPRAEATHGLDPVP